MVVSCSCNVKYHSTFDRSLRLGNQNKIIQKWSILEIHSVPWVSIKSDGYMNPCSGAKFLLIVICSKHGCIWSKESDESALGSCTPQYMWLTVQFCEIIIRVAH